MAKHNDIGNFGENIAQNFLLRKGCQILERNWRWGKGELDLIVQDKDVIVFVEVKTRKNLVFGTPEAAVNYKKQQFMYELAVEYLHRIQHEGEIRFDIVAIVLEPELDIQHFEDAFFPNWI